MSNECPPSAVACSEELMCYASLLKSNQRMVATEDGLSDTFLR
jgi:hypothetical protein